MGSDDGSRLIIDGKVVVDNDGLHGSGDVAGQVALKAGMHFIEMRMFQAKGDKDLRLSIRGPGFAKRVVDKSDLFHNVL